MKGVALGLVEGEIVLFNCLLRRHTDLTCGPCSFKQAWSVIRQKLFL